MKRALIIEDNENNLELITYILKANGYSCLSATLGQEGLETAVKELPDFILLDIQLPDIPGTEVLRRLRAQHETASIPIIAVTSYAMAGDREMLLSAGCDGYIEKPIDPALVMDQLLKILKGL